MGSLKIEVVNTSEQDDELVIDEQETTESIKQLKEDIEELKKLIELEENSKPQIVVSSESVSPSNVQPTEPSSYDLLVNLMDHFNLNAIINSIQDDTLDQQIKPVSKSIDNSEEDLQESIVIPSEVPEVKTTTSRVEISTAENVQETTTQTVSLPKIANIAKPSRPSFDNFPSIQTNEKANPEEEMVHIVMPAGWSEPHGTEEETASEESQEASRSTTVEPAIPRASTINSIIIDTTTESDTKGTISSDGFIIATNKPLIRFPTKKATVVEKKVRLQNLQPVTTTAEPTSAEPTTVPTTTTKAPTTTTTTTTTSAPKRSQFLSAQYSSPNMG